MAKSEKVALEYGIHASLDGPITIVTELFWGIDNNRRDDSNDCSELIVDCRNIGLCDHLHVNSTSHCYSL